MGAASGFAPAAQFASPMVSAYDSLGRDSFSPMLSRVFQVRSARRPQTAFLPPSPAPVFDAPGFPFSGGRQHLGHQPGAVSSRLPSQSGITASQMGTQRSVVPAPTVSLQIRLKEMDPSLLEYKESRLSMKSVDLVTEHFTMVYSGDSGQDWINHVNELERQQAVKHQWIPRQFYFALTITLAGKAKQTLANMEKGMERPKLQDFIPTWYYPSQQE